MSFGMPPSPPTEFYTRAQINRAFGLYGLGDAAADANIDTPIGLSLGIGLIGAVAGGVLGALLPSRNRYKNATAGALLGAAAGGAVESVRRWPTLDSTYGGAFKTARWGVVAGTAAFALAGGAVAWKGR